MKARGNRSIVIDGEEPALELLVDAHAFYSSLLQVRERSRTTITLDGRRIDLERLEYTHPAPVHMFVVYAPNAPKYSGQELGNIFRDRRGWGWHWIFKIYASAAGGTVSFGNAYHRGYNSENQAAERYEYPWEALRRLLEMVGWDEVVPRKEE